MLPDLGVNHMLLLQGPAGPFMRRFADELREAGVRVTKVNFHAGDDFFFSGPEKVSFREPFDRWPAFLDGLMEARGVDGIALFGDCRPLHRAAIELAEHRGAKVWCLEEGYLRPDWITLEAHGVNGYSRMPRDPAFYRALELPEPESPLSLGPRFHYVSWYSTLNALAFTLCNRGYPHYEHHRILNAWYHTFVWVRNVARKAYFAQKERGLLPLIEGPLSGRYFFVPLQVHCDFQLRHSRYSDVLEFVREVVEAFRAHARPDDAIVFKHHPMDRAYREYTAFFREIAAAHDLEDRLYYCHDLHLPTLLKHAKGTITINSTVGLQSISLGTPVITTGVAVYDMEGLTHQGSLESFLEDRSAPDRELYEAFRRYLIHVNQCNGSFYLPIESLGTPTGVRWWREPEPPGGAARRGGTLSDERAPVK